MDKKHPRVHGDVPSFSPCFSFLFSPFPSFLFSNKVAHVVIGSRETGARVRDSSLVRFLEQSIQLRASCREGGAALKIQFSLNRQRMRERRAIRRAFRYSRG